MPNWCAHVTMMHVSPGETLCVTVIGMRRPFVYSTLCIFVSILSPLLLCDSARDPEDFPKKSRRLCIINLSYETDFQCMVNFEGCADYANITDT